MKTVNELVPQNEVKNTAFSKDHEQIMEMSALCLIVTVMLILVPSLILFLIITFKKNNHDSHN